MPRNNLPIDSAQTFEGLVFQVITLINNWLIPIVVGLSLLAFFWGAARFIFSSADSGSHESGKQLMIWGSVGLFVMFSIWGILRVLQFTFFSSIPL